MMRPTLTALLLSLSIAGCGKGSSSGGGAVPAQPADGAPIAFEVVKFTPGTDRDGKVDVKGYNFTDKTFNAYAIAVRFTDDKGAPIKVGVGTPFEKDNAWTSMAGHGFECRPKAWCKLEVEMIEVPPATKKAEAALTSASEAGSNKPFWESPKGMADWPL